VALHVAVPRNTTASRGTSFDGETTRMTALSA